MSTPEHLDKVYIKFIDWKAKPKKPEAPQTIEEFCNAHEISKADTVSFIDRPTFADDLLSATLDWARQKTPELLHSLYHEAKTTKNPLIIEKFITMAHELKKKKDEKSTTYQQFNFFNVDDERYKRIIARENERLAGGSTQ